MAKNDKSLALVNLDDEDSIGATGEVGKVVSVAKRQAAGARKSFDEAPKCPHCGGRMHMNLPIATTNFECLFRQYSLETGAMESPEARFPAFTAADMEPFNDWIKARSRSRKKPLTYGKMESAGGGAPTYAMAKSTVAADPAAVVEKVKSKKKTGAAAAAAIAPAPAPVAKASKKSKAAEVEADAPAVKAKKTKAVAAPATEEFSFSSASLPSRKSKSAPPLDNAPAKKGIKMREAPAQTPPTAPRKAPNTGRRAAALAAVK